MKNLQGTTALITGGGTGIGLATAALMLEQGANVVIAGRTPSRLKEASSKLNGGTRLETFAADVSSEGHAKRLVAETIKRFGAIDILVNNAGVFKGGPLLEMEEEDFDYNIDVNLKGTWFMCRYAVGPMKEQGRGSIVNVASFLGIRGFRGLPSSAYAAAKGGVLALTTSLAVELAQDQIRVNAVVPALVNTPMLETMVDHETVKKMLENAKRTHPIGRAGEPIDVARAIVFLANPANDWVTGVNMTVDGGMSLV